MTADKIAREDIHEDMLVFSPFGEPFRIVDVLGDPEDDESLVYIVPEEPTPDVVKVGHLIRDFTY